MICGCGRPTTGALLCARCRHTTDVAIANVAAYYDDLETVRTRQTRYGRPTGPSGTEKPLGMDARFAPGGIGAKATRATRASMKTWAEAVLIHHPGLEPPAHDTVRSVCAFFARNLPTIASAQFAPAFKADMLAIEHLLGRIVDRPPDAWYAGECGAELGDHDGTSCACACHGPERYDDGTPYGPIECDIPGGCHPEIATITCTRLLYATPGNDYVRCPECGTQHDVATRRQLLVHEAEDRHATVELITRIVTTLGDRDVSTAKIAARIRQWAQRGRITAHGTRVIDGRARPVYRIGDVLDLLGENPK